MNNDKSNSIRINRDYLDSLLIEGRIVGAVHPSCEVSVLGKTFATPVIPAAMSHLKTGMAAWAEGARLAGALGSVGMGSISEMEAVYGAYSDVIKVIKPYADPAEIFSRIRAAERLGAFGVGMDVEHAINQDDDADSLVVGFQMKLPTLEELKRYVQSTRLPFFIKGALSVQDALHCREIGCAGVILSHHNGLMRWAVPPAMMLPEIRTAVGPDFIMIADGGIADGYDAFKALALGADLVSVGKVLMDACLQGGSRAMADKIAEITRELKGIMARTGAKDLRSIDPTVLHPAPFRS